MSVHLIRDLNKTMCGLRIGLDIGITVYPSQCNCEKCNEIEAAHVAIDTDIEHELEDLRDKQFTQYCPRH